MYTIDSIIEDILNSPNIWTHHPEPKKYRYLEYDNFLPSLNNNSVCLEFGVNVGYSLQYCAWKRPDCSWYGFDSFRGLPEDWIQNSMTVKRKGVDWNHFGIIPQIPETHKFCKDCPEQWCDNVVLIPGWFSETINLFIEKYQIEKVDMINIDCDIYSSTKDVLFLLNSHIEEGCILHFDDFGWYEKFKEHQIKAFVEWLNEFDRKVEVVYQTKLSVSQPAHLYEYKDQGSQVIFKVLK